MKVTPVHSPHAIAQAQSTGTNPEARARAIAKLTGGNTTNTPKAAQPAINAQVEAVANPNQVSLEELSAVKAPTQTTETIVESTDSIEATAAETTDAPETTKEEQPKVDPTLSRQFAQLARQEKALRAKAQQQAQEFKQREEAIKAREAALSQTKPDLSNYIPKDTLKTDPLRVLADAGLSYEELTQQILTQQPRDPRTEAHIVRLEAKLADLEAKAETSAKTYQEQQQQQYQQAVKQITMDVKQLVSKDPNFETIKSTNSIKDVVELIETTYKEDGHLMTVEEAAQEVEEYLVEEAMKLTNIDKIKKRMAAANASKPKSEVKTPATQTQTQPTMKTLTNATASQRQLSPRERAELAFRGELKRN